MPCVIFRSANVTMIVQIWFVANGWLKVSPKPNIILFLTDDHARWALGATQDPYALTPNLDFMARNGVMMENAFTPVPVCSPARACVFTGRLPSQHGIHDYLGDTASGDVNKNWLANETPLYELFRTQGYETALVGKWHLGQEHTKKDHFDFSFTLGTEYPIMHGEPRTYYHGEKEVLRDGSITRTITNETLRFLKERDRSKPLFLVVGHYATHSQWRGHRERLVDYYRQLGVQARDHALDYPFGSQRNESLDPTRDDPVEALCQYYAAVTQIDESVGAILDEIEGQEIVKDTIFVYTSDHGLNCGDHGLWGKGNATYPANMLDQSIRVPLIFYGPGILFSRQRRPESVDHMDLFQTLLDLASIQECEEDRDARNSPGRSFAPMITNGAISGTWKSDQYCEYGPVRMIRTRQFKLTLYPDPSCNLLVDHVHDPSEVTNLYGDSGYSAVVSSLSGRIGEFFGTYTSGKFDGRRCLDALPQYNALHAWEPE